ncbi:MAG: phenylalanine--tRNA ligase subunit beta [Gemmatimonadetes bacterium]|nr:phenylalanine--tRNA ligase subunit beta [Gemmatimonadota bacterium]
MKASARWLRELVPGLNASAEEIADRLALRGAPVESIVALAEGLEHVVVAKVITAERHPNADRLSLCTVDGGQGVVSVVCGAPNVKSGGWYPFAPVGAVLPGGLEIKKAKIRGETSNGMLCSAKELGLSSDHAGILELSGQFTPGEPFVAAMGLDDATLDVEISVNRGDLLSHVGLARELATDAAGDVARREIPGAPAVAFRYEPGTPEVRVGGVSVRIDDPDLCPRYLGAVIRGIRVGPSPAWLQERLRGAGARPINNVVDATNYVMLELGHPLHAFDLGRMAGSAVVVRRARTGESKFTTLDGVERALTSDMLMICDAEKPVGVAGVMGGLHSEVEPDTTDVLLECALFSPKSIRATRKALGMSTDASYRFERGVDPEGMRHATERCVTLILATAGGTLDGPVLDCSPSVFEPQVIELRLARIERLLGIPFTADAVRGLLSPLGFQVLGAASGGAAATLRVRVPGFRSWDVKREVDLIEEIARTHGFDKFPSQLGPYRAGTVPDHPLFQLEDSLRAALVGRGLFEAHTPAFAPEDEGDVEVSYPLSATERFLRRSLVPGLLRRVEHNFAHLNRDVRLFEIGTSFRRAGKGEPPREATCLAAVLTGLRTPSHWSAEDEPFSVWDLKGLLEDVAGRVYGADAAVTPGCSDARFDGAASFKVSSSGGAEVGRGGRAAKGAVDAPVWAGDVWALELELPAVPAASAPVSHRPLPTLPPIDRDLALIVPASLSAGALETAIVAGGGRLLESVTLFDVYAGPGIPAGTRSLAFRLRFRASERTLKDAEVDKAVTSLLATLEDLGVGPRG